MSDTVSDESMTLNTPTRHARFGGISWIFLIGTLVCPAAVTAQVTRVSVATGGVQSAAETDLIHAVSFDGRYVAFSSGGDDLVTGDTNGQHDVFVHDRVTSITTRVSVATGFVQATGADSFAPAISGDGRYVGFVSLATNLVAGDTNGQPDVFVHDRVTSITARVSVATGGAQATGGLSRGPGLSADGRYVTFYSAATNLVTGDTNGLIDVFIHDRHNGTTSRVSVASDGSQALDGPSLSPTSCMSADGRFVTFLSAATNLVSGDTNGEADVFVHDRQTGATTRVNVATSGTQAIGGGSDFPTISPDGRRIAFESSATNLVPDDTNGVTDIFVRDRQTGTTTRISVRPDGTEATEESSAPSFSGDGSRVAFHSEATDLVADDTNGMPDIFVTDEETGTTIRVNVDANGNQAASGYSYYPALSADGRYVSFASVAPNLIPGDTNSQVDVFVHDIGAFQRRRVSVTAAGGEANGAVDTPGIGLSADGRYVAFRSTADNLVDDDTNAAADVFVRDRAAGTTDLASRPSSSTQANGVSGAPAFSHDGRFMAFLSSASNLVPGDTNANSDVFVRDRLTEVVTRVSVATGGEQSFPPTEGCCEGLDLSDDGRYVVFSSAAPDLVNGDTNGRHDVFVHDRVMETTTRVSVSSAGQQALGRSSGGELSADGRYVVFESDAANLVSGDTNGAIDVFVHDGETGQTRRVSVSSSGAEATGGSRIGSRTGSISADGRCVAFESEATNLVSNDTNGKVDIFLHDLQTGQTNRVSVSSTGAEANDPSELGSQSISGDGRYIVFSSAASNLVTGDTNDYNDVFVHDRTSGETRRVSVGDDFVQANGDSDAATISSDGRVIAYRSLASNLVSDDTNGQRDVFIRALTPELYGVAPASGPITGGTSVQIPGAGFAPGTTVAFGGTPAINVDSSSDTLLALTTPPHIEGLVNVRVTVPGFDPERLVLAYAYVPSFSPTTDTDGDGISDALEAQYSLDLLNPSDSTIDSDGDGVNNADEIAAGTHPRGTVVRYLAEGATGSFFDTELAMTNPGDTKATTLLRFLTSTGANMSQLLPIAPHSRATVDVGSIAGLATAEFSTVLESDHPIVLERTMRWDSGYYGSHLETASDRLSTTWYLAEGATHSNFELFYLLQNPHSTTTMVTVRFLRPAPQAPVIRTYTLAPTSRFNIWVDQIDPALAATDVSAVITATQPILVERAMYLSTSTSLFLAGHESLAVREPALSWFLAEGATGPYFDLFVLLANPNNAAAQVMVTYLKPDGTTIVRPYTVAAQSRFNIWVDLEDPSLADAAVSTTLQVTNGMPIVVERAMWWPGSAPTWQEAHNSAGATTTGIAWATASGEDGGPRSSETYILVANTASYEATVDVTLFFEDGSTTVKTFVIAPTSRFTVAVRNEFPGAINRRFGALVESVGLGTAPLVVEQAVYGDAGGIHWQAGSNALAAKLR